MGGTGKDLSKLRPRGAKVSNAALTSTGAASFMQVDSELTKEVAQEGRRGALMLSLDVRHPDVLEFIEAKRNKTKITAANISIQLTDDFMQAVIEDLEYILRYPVDTDITKSTYNFNELEYNVLYKDPTLSGFKKSVYIKKVRAKEIWNTFVKCNWESAEPGIMFKDKHHNYSPDGVYEQYRGVASNPCQPAWATVLTPDGIRTFNDINIGDKIWSKQGWTTVVNKVNSGIKDVYEYKTTGGIFYGTENHRVVSNGVKIEVKDAESIDIISGDSSRAKVKNSKCEKACIDGLIIGDGSVHKVGSSLVYLCIGENDYDYFNSPVKEFILKHRPALKSYAYEVDTTIKADELPLTYNRSVPERYFQADSYTVCQFLRGLFSANGSVVGNRVTLKTSSTKLRDEVQIMLSSIGIRSYYTTNKAKDVIFSNGTYTCKESYDINIGVDRSLFYENIGFIQEYKNLKLEKTLIPFKEVERTHNIVSRSLVSTEEVFDITVDNSSHTYWTGGVNVSNCSEIYTQAYDSCRLIHLNLLSFVNQPFTQGASFNLELFKEVVHYISRLADDAVDIEIASIDRILEKIKKEGDPDNAGEIEVWQKLRSSGLKGRRCGIGFTALSDTLAALGVKLNSTDALEWINTIMLHKETCEMEAQVDMAIIRGAFDGWDKNKEFIKFGDDVFSGKNAYYQHLIESCPELIDKLYKYGRRNISSSTVAPTGTVSILTKSTSGIEPLFRAYYTRRRKVSEGNDFNFTDETGEKFQETLIIHKGLTDWIKAQGLEVPTDLKELDKLYQSSPYFECTAADLTVEQRIRIQQIVQEYTSHSISSTINMPSATSPEAISELYITAWASGLKGVTTYRDGCRDGILNEVGKPALVFPQYDAPKRPETLKAESHIVKVKGVKYAVIVGLLEGKPYEVFAAASPPGFTAQKGTITKVKKKTYKWIGENEDILTNIRALTDSDEEKLCTLAVSMLLRTGAKISFVVKMLKKASPNITSFASAISRVLSEYIGSKEVSGDECPDCGAKLTREAGCVKCDHCSYSVCLITIEETIT